jgi:hypothetical protein
MEDLKVALGILLVIALLVALMGATALTVNFITQNGCLPDRKGTVNPLCCK